jgi:hypothetical protein
MSKLTKHITKVQLLLIVHFSIVISPKDKKALIHYIKSVEFPTVASISSGSL